MARTNPYLTAGGVLSALIAGLHLALAAFPALYGYVAPGQSALTEMAVQGSRVTTMVSLALAFLLAVWAVYGFSGAGLIRPLPLLRAALLAIGAIYVLRALFLPTEVRMVLAEGYPLRFVLFSILSLAAGLLYLIGSWKQRAAVPRGRPRAG